MTLPIFSLSLSDIQHIVDLSRLELADSEAAHMQGQLNHFFRFVAQIQAMETHGIEPLANPVEEHLLPLRDDALTEFPNRGAYQNCAPEICSGLYRVPKVIE